MKKEKIWKYIIWYLALLVILICAAAITAPDKNLHIIACDVGQGDSFLITRGSSQILIDGGPGNKVLTCLGKYVPFWDRTIELTILSHPQTDHYQGLIEVFKRYEIKSFLTTELDASASSFKVLKELARSEGSRILYANEELSLSNNLMYLDVVYPTSKYLSENAIGEDDVLGAMITKTDPNNFSVILSLSYGAFDALFTGDIGPEAIDDVIETGKIKEFEYLKIPHHGSKNGLTKRLLNIINPEIAVISSGKNNRYGHPHKEIIEMLKEAKVKVLRTDEEGDVIISSDGKTYWRGM